MSVERRNPVPKGRYWVWIVDTKHDPGARLYFSSWLLRNSKSVKVVKVEHTNRLIDRVDADWYLFDVSSPVKWETDRGFGFPTVVRSAENPNAPIVTTSADTAPPHPPIPSLSSQISDFFAGVNTTALVLALAYLLSRSDR